MQQLALLEPKSQTQTKPILTVVPVQDRGVSPLGSDRYFLTVQQGDRSWSYPLQLLEVEARWLLPGLEGLDWSLETNGYPADIERIHAIVERAIDSRLAGGVK